MNMNSEQKTTKQLKETLLHRIESENVCPKSKLFFQSRECLVWFLWMLSVVVGAFAVAVSLFVVIHHQYAFYEATHDNFFTFLVDALPYLWFMVFGLMAYVAVFNIRNTSHGYKYSVSIILGSSLVLSFAGGSALQLFGFGYSIDHILGSSMNSYMSQEKIEKKLWQEPAEGRLMGKQVFGTLAPTSTIIFEDISGNRWRMNITELPQRDINLLASEKTVKLIGKQISSPVSIFHACGAFPWMMDKNITMNDMKTERNLFIERVNEHAKKVKEQIIVTKGSTLATMELSEQSICSTIKPVRKMPPVRRAQ
jgi:hypothetical protein